MKRHHMGLNEIRNNEKGMVTIEATIALTSFLFIFLMIYSIITICRAQAHIQVALNNTAQELSRYSYLYGLSGLDKSFEKFQGSAEETKKGVNTFVDDSIKMFEGIQTLGQDAKKVDISNVNSMMDNWEQISNDVINTKDDFSGIKQQIENMASNPQQLLFGMARLMGSEALEVAKSRVIAEPITKVLIKKHLKRNETDTADAFCQSVGIIKGTYLGKESYFNGIDFSLSTLFPYGCEDITLVATYKIKLLQLIPIDIEYKITQAAKTKGWLHGDKSVVSGKMSIENIQKKDPDASVWNTYGLAKVNEINRDEQLARLKKLGYTNVSGETYIQAYNPDSKTFAMVASCNPIYEAGSVDKIDKAAVEEAIKKHVSEMKSATDTKKVITVKETKNGKTTTRDITLPEQEKKVKIVLVVPEDEGVKAYVENVIQEMGYAEYYEVVAANGTGVKKPEKTEESKEGNSDKEKN